MKERWFRGDRAGRERDLADELDRDEEAAGWERPPPGKVRRSMRLAAEKAGRPRRRGRAPAPGKVSLMSYLQPAFAVSEAPERSRRLIEDHLGRGTYAAAIESAWREEATPLAAQLGVDPEIRADDEARRRTEERGARGLAGDDAIYLHPERIEPGTSEGRRVLVHELVHVAQARNAAAGTEVERAAAEAEAAAAAAGQRLAPPEHAIDLGKRAAADIDADKAPPAESGEAPFRWVSGTYRLWIKKSWFTGAGDFQQSRAGWSAPSRCREILASLREQGLLDWAGAEAIGRAAQQITVAPVTADLGEVDLGPSLIGALGLPSGIRATAYRRADGGLDAFVALSGADALLGGEFPLSPPHLGQVVAAVESTTDLTVDRSATDGDAALTARVARGRAHTVLTRAELERWLGREQYRAWLERATRTEQATQPAVQARGSLSGESSWVHARASEGLAESGRAIPYLDKIQPAFGRHQVGTIDAHVGGAAAVAAAAIGAGAYAAGEKIAFAAAPDLHTAAHEAAHVIQQRGGVDLAAGVGRAGDAYERHADAVADRVVEGESAEALLDQMAGGSRADASEALQLDEGEAQVAEDQALASPPPVTMSVQFGGLVFTSVKGTNWIAGIDKTLLVYAMAVKALLADDKAYTPELARQADRAVRTSGGTLDIGDGVSGRAVQGEEMGAFRIAPSLALELIGFLRDTKKLPLALGRERIDKLLLGQDIKNAWFFIKNVDPPLPPWYGEDLFWDQILAAEYEPLIVEFRAAYSAMQAGRNAKTEFATRKALGALVAPLRPDAELLERVRADASLTDHEAYPKLWPHPVMVNAEMAARFLQQARTNRTAGAQAREDGPEASKARRTLLDGMLLVADDLDDAKEEGATGDSQLRSTDGRANAPPVPSRMAAYPSLPPPHVKPAGTTHVFTMGLEYPSGTLEALGAMVENVFTWQTIKVPNDDVDRLADTARDARAKGYRPSFTDVAGQEAKRQWGYLDSDQKRVRAALEGVEVALGPMQVGVDTLLAANRALGALGRVIRTAIYEYFEPASQETIPFDQGEGLYVVRCAVHRPAKDDDQFVRAPSVAWHAVLVRDAKVVASDELAGQLRIRSSHDDDLQEIERKLASGAISDPVQVAAMEERAADLRIALYGSVEGGLVAERRSLEKRRDELERQRRSGGSPEARAVEQEREQIGVRLDEIAEILEVRRERHDEHTVAGLEGPVRIPTAFVGDEGQTLSLLLEAIEQPREGGKFAYHVTDATTKSSSEATGDAQSSRADAIASAVKTLLEKSSGYGPGYVSIHIPAPGGRVLSLPKNADAAPHMRQIRIDADLTAIAMSGVDNVAMALSIAAVAAAPLTGGASLAFLIPIGAVGAIPSAYRLLDRSQSGTLRMDLDAAMDFVNIVGGAAGIGQMAKVGLRSAPVGRGIMAIGIGSDRLGVALAGAQLIEQARNIDPNAPPGVRLAMLAEIVGGQMIEMGIEGGTLVARRGQALKVQRAGAGVDVDLKLGSSDLHRLFHAAARSDALIFEDSSLAPNTAEVRHDLDGYGLVTKVRVAMAPGASPDAVLAHAPAVAAIGRFERAQGMLRNLIDRGIVLGRSVARGRAAEATARVGAELERLPAVMRDLQQQAAAGKLDPRQAEAKAADLVRQMERHERAFDMVEADLASTPGSGIPPHARRTARVPPHEADTQQFEAPHERDTQQFQAPHERDTQQFQAPHERDTQQFEAPREPYVPVERVAPDVKVSGARPVLDDLPDLKNIGALPESVIGAHQASLIEPALQGLSDADYVRFRAIASSLPDPVARGYLYKALAAKNSVASIEWLADELAGKKPAWMADNLTLIDSRGVGVGLVQQWSSSCNAATAIVLRGSYDPVFALRMRHGNMAVGRMDRDNPENMNLHQAEMERDMLESPYVGQGWFRDYGYGHVGRPRPHNTDDGVGRMGDDLFNRQAQATGLEFDSTMPMRPTESISILDQALSQGMQVPVILGTWDRFTAHYVIAVQRRVRPDGGVDFLFHNVGDGTTTWVSAELIADHRIPLAGGHYISGIERPRTYEPPRPTRQVSVQPVPDSTATSRSREKPRAAAPGQPDRDEESRTSNNGPAERSGARPPPTPLATDAEFGVDPTPESIRDGTVRMEQHPDYARVMREVQAKGFRIVESDQHPQVFIREIVDEEGNHLRYEKDLRVKPNMRFLDLEHELGHVQQLLERFDRPLPTDRITEYTDGRRKKSRDQSKLVTMDKNAVLEYHNRLIEWLRLKENGAASEVLVKHADGVREWRREANKRRMRIEGSGLNRWMREHFPDLNGLELRYADEDGVQFESESRR